MNKDNKENTQDNKIKWHEKWRVSKNRINILHEYTNDEKIKVALLSILASASLAVTKLIIALITNSLGILSEALHSSLDIGAAAMTLYAVSMSKKPPDLDHNYGHEKFESLTSLGSIIVLFVVAGWILYEGIERIFVKDIIPDVNIFSFIILISSIIIDYTRSKSLYRIANKYGSQAIESDALHFKADMITSSIVLIGILLVYLFGLSLADTIAAILIAGLIIYTSLGLGRKTLDILLDKAPKGIHAQILESITGFEGIKKAHRVRVRKVGTQNFVDLCIEVPRVFTHDKAHRIATNVENKIRNDILPNSDVVVHVEAIEDTLTETIKDKIKLISEEFPQIKNIHSIYLSDIITEKDHKVQEEAEDNPYTHSTKSTQLHLYLDVQMDNSLDFKTAHDVIDDFENKIKQQIQIIKRVTTHMETELDIESSVGHEELIDPDFLKKIKNIVFTVEGIVECKDISLVYISNNLHITLTIKINPLLISKENKTLQEINDQNKKKDNNLSIEKAHEISTIVQNLLLENTPASRVIIHAEPA